VVSEPTPHLDQVQARLAKQRAMVQALPASTKVLLKSLCVVQGIAVFVAGVMTLGFLWAVFKDHSLLADGTVVAVGVAAWLVVLVVEMMGRALSGGAGNWGTAVWR